MKSINKVTVTVVIVAALILGGIYYYQVQKKVISDPPPLDMPTILPQIGVEDPRLLNLEDALIENVFEGYEADCYPEEREQIYVYNKKYFDFDKDGKDEIIVYAATCLTGSAGPDVIAVYRLVNGRLIEIPREKEAYTDSWKNYGLSIEDGILVETLPIYLEGDGNCCPTGGTRKIYYNFRGSKFVAKEVKLIPLQEEDRP